MGMKHHPLNLFMKSQVRRRVTKRVEWLFSQRCKSVCVYICFQLIIY